MDSGTRNCLGVWNVNLKKKTKKDNNQNKEKYSNSK